MSTTIFQGALKCPHCANRKKLMPYGFHLTGKGHYELCVYVDESKKRMEKHQAEFVRVCDTYKKALFHHNRLNARYDEKASYALDNTTEVPLYFIYKFNRAKADESTTRKVLK